MLFKLLELEEPGSHKACRFGDAVWLQICGGPGEPSWRHGSVVGAKVVGACNLPTVPIDPNVAANTSAATKSRRAWARRRRSSDAPDRKRGHVLPRDAP